MWRTIFGALTAEEARELARKECELRGWPWAEPIMVKRELWEFHVMTNASKRGGNVNVWIDARSRRVKRSAFVRR